MRDFKHLSKSGKTQASRYLRVRFSKQEDVQVTRFAFVISKKTAKLAVRRNRARRQLREAVKKELSSLKQGYDIALYIKAPFLPLSFQEKHEQVQYVLKKAKLYD